VEPGEAQAAIHALQNDPESPWRDADYRREPENAARLAALYRDGYGVQETPTPASLPAGMTSAEARAELARIKQRGEWPQRDREDYATQWETRIAPLLRRAHPPATPEAAARAVDPRNGAIQSREEVAALADRPAVQGWTWGADAEAIERGVVAEFGMPMAQYVSLREQGARLRREGRPDRAVTERFLRERWGAEFEAKLEKAERAVQRLPPAMQQYLRFTGLNDHGPSILAIVRHLEAREGGR